MKDNENAATAAQSEKAFRISIGASRNSLDWRVESWTWPALTARLRQCKRTPETVAEYQEWGKISKDKSADRKDRDAATYNKARAKDVGGFVGGALKEDGPRKKDKMADRCIVALDIDKGTADTLANARGRLSAYAWFAYTTHSHTPAAPRYRLIVPLLEPVTVEEYEPLARWLANEVGINGIDGASYEINQLMYWPSAPKDGQFEHEEHEGIYFDARTVLELYYADWRDATEWPRSADEIEKNVTPRGSGSGVKMEDPRTKAGYVGAFCRVHDIHNAIRTYLGGVYEPTAKRDRYTLAGKAADGLHVLDNGLFAYAYDESSPFTHREVNAYDLVRIHLFGDDKVSGGGLSASERAMNELCEKDDAVRAEYERSKPARPSAEEVFADAAPANGNEAPAPLGGSASGQREPVAVFQLSAEDNKAANQALSLNRILKQGESIKGPRARRLLADLLQLSSDDTEDREEWSKQLSQTFADELRDIVNLPEPLRSKWDLGEVRHGVYKRYGSIELWPGELSVLCAATSHCKTAFALNLAQDFAKSNINKTFLYLAVEGDKPEILFRALNLFIDDIPTQKPGQTIKGAHFVEERRRAAIRAALSKRDRCSGYGEDFPELREKILKEVDRYEREMRPALTILHTGGTIEAIKRNLEQYIADQREKHAEIGGIFVDYIQLIESEQDDYSRHDELKTVCKALKDCAKATGVPMLIAAQLNRAALSLSLDAITTANIAEAADIERIAHDIYFVWKTSKTRTHEYFKHVTESTKLAGKKAGDHYPDLIGEKVWNYTAGERTTRLFKKVLYTSYPEVAKTGLFRELMDGYVYVEQWKARDGRADGWALYPFDGESGRIGEIDKDAMGAGVEVVMEDFGKQAAPANGNKPETPAKASSLLAKALGKTQESEDGKEDEDDE